MRIALITGSGRKGGLGFETAKQLGARGYHTILAARRMEQITPFVEELKSLGISASPVVVDITDDKSIIEAASTVEMQYGKLDVLINNAAMLKAGESIEKMDIDELRSILDTNVVGTWSVTQKFLPLLIKSDQGRIVNVSSSAGSLEDPQYGFINGALEMPTLGYDISKLAMNGLTIKMAKEFKQYKMLVNSVCPDITDTFGTGGGRPVSESAKGIVWAATLPDDGPTGLFFRDGKQLPW
ncbi:SDR family NAD(P)-dependent oxidoreductase [Paenibacillus bovis]|uniref:Short-chain dehydrogenase n=1 Tax=Paenibacillus bovis TaxID=1616788 RepID=A0A172ZBS5_9BACL|nr:SDR family NAD(P)-dependent oxidoreductase [Paenibacillus bovis]ANF94822.1 short-chain dehydrogenase [Paenibacillus bovis]